MNGAGRAGAGHERVAEWDAAYVLGALSAADRREFEQHLDGCELCRANLAELAGVPGLLARVGEPDREDLLEAREHEAAPPSLLPRLEAAVRKQRGRRRIAAGTLLAAAAAVVTGLAVPPLVDALTERPTTVALSPIVDVPLEASVDLVATGAGTRIDMTCTYEYGAGAGGERSYDLVVIDTAGAEETVSTWTTDEGSVVEISASVGTPAEDITALELRDTESGRVLLAGGVNPPSD